MKIQISTGTPELLVFLFLHMRAFLFRQVVPPPTLVEKFRTCERARAAMRGIAHAHVLSVAGRVAFRLGQHGSAERAVQTAYYWEWLRAVPTADTDDDKDGADAPGWLGRLLEEIADWMESHEEWAALVVEQKAQLRGRLHELFTEDGLDQLRGRAEQLWDSNVLLDPILEVM